MTQQAAAASQKGSGRSKAGSECVDEGEFRKCVRSHTRGEGGRERGGAEEGGFLLFYGVVLTLEGER